MTVDRGLGVTWRWPRPWYEPGAAVGRDTGVYPVSIDGREYMVDTASGLYRRFSVDLLRTRQNRVPNENLLLEPEVWRSMVESWHQGAGQTRKDRESSLPYRYFASKNIDPWDQWGIGLLRETAPLASTPGETVRVYAVPQRLVLVGTDTVHTFPDLDPATESTIALPSPALSSTSDGQNIHVLCADDTVYLVDPVAETVTAEVTLPAPGSLVAYVKGFLVAAVGPALYDVSSGVADDTTLIYSAPLGGHRWVAATDGLAAGYLLGGQGDKWFAYWITVRDDAATLNPPVVAAPLPEGEIGYSLGSYLGFVLIGTDKGVRFCTPAGDNTLTYGRLVVTDSPVTDFEGQDRFVWFGIGGHPRDLDEPLRQPEAGLARMDLSTFTAPLTPAYAADLVARDVTDVEGVGAYVTTYQGRRVFSTDGAVYMETGSYAGEGWLTEGVFNQAVRDRKIALYVSVSCEPLPDGTAVSTSVAFDSTSYPDPQVRIDAPGSVASGNVDLEGVRYEGMLARHMLSSDGSATPRLTRFEERSTPVIGRAHEWQVPLLVFDGMFWEDVTFSRDVRADVDHIISLVENGRVFTYREGGQTYDCFSPGYEWRPEKLTSDGESWQGVLILRVRQVR